MTGTQLAERYRVSSNWTRGSSMEKLAGKISGFLSPLSHKLWITAAIRRRTPRVLWNFTRVDQSL